MPKDLPSIPKDQAIIIFGVTRENIRGGYTIAFSRMGPSPEVSASSADHQPDIFAGFKGWGFEPKERIYSYAVPPGRWRIDAIAALATDGGLDLCLGSPSFEVKAGDIIYAGSFDLAGEAIGPDMAMEPATDWLGSNSEFAAKAKPAIYRNGSRGPCGEAFIYAFDIDSAPYEDGYGWRGVHAEPDASSATQAHRD